MQTKNQTICCQLLTAQTAAVIPPVHRECWSKEAVVQGAVTDLSCSVTRQNLKDPTDNKCTETFRLCSLLYRVCCFMSREKTELTHSCIKHLGLEEHSLTASEPLFATPPTPDPVFDVSTSTSPHPVLRLLLSAVCALGFLLGKFTGREVLVEMLCQVQKLRWKLPPPSSAAFQGLREKVSTGWTPA